VLTRFAPSPTGYLHLGHALAAKEAFSFRPCLLRIEDIDHTRCKPKFTDAIYEDLAWLGFTWPKPVRVQSEHMADYQDVLNTLGEQGLTYRCFKTRRELDISPPAPLSSNQEENHMADGLPFALRLNLKACRDHITSSLKYKDTGEEKTVDLKALEDIVLARKDIGTSYHIAVTHDDALQDITHVVRGADFIEQTPYHVLLQNLLGYPTPIYRHHALLLREDGEKLSKRNRDTTIRSLREKGLTPQQVLDMATS